MPNPDDLPPLVYCGVCRAPNSIENKQCDQCGAAIDLATPTASTSSNIGSLLANQSIASAEMDVETSADPTDSLWYKGYWLLVVAANVFNLKNYFTTPGISSTNLLYLAIVPGSLAVIIAVAGIISRKKWGVVLLVAVALVRAIILVIEGAYFQYILSDLLSLVIPYVVLKPRWYSFT